MDRSLSLITPTGRLTLGNYLGALRRFVAAQDAGSPGSCFFGLSDLHALTTPQDPNVLRTTITEMSTLFLAAGLDPSRSILFRQSQVPAHRELAYLLECTAHIGELNRMTQFKQKGRSATSTRVSMYTYPALMAADILLYQPSVVPVGDDQRQHVELTRDLAIRFNRTYGNVFVLPEARTPSAGARVMDLQDPTAKMSKSLTTDLGVIRLLDGPDVVRRKVARAVTDSEVGPDSVRASKTDKPGVTNLREILEACGGSAAGITTYGALKASVTEAIVAVLDPVQKAYVDLAKDPGYVASVFAEGSAQARVTTATVITAAAAAMGL